MNKEPIISFIIPFYNREDTLSRCIGSVLKDFSCNYEIILVDDASTDSSSIVCKEYTDQYSNIKYIKSERNRGPGNARNRGMDIASGKYLYFLDSDDEISAGVLPKLVDVMTCEEPDFIYMKHVHIWPNGEKRQKGVNLPEGFISVEDFLTQYPDKPSSPAWICAYKAEFIRKCGIRFTETYINEDYYFLTSVFTAADSLYILPKSFGNYHAPGAAELKSKDNFERISEGFMHYFSLNHALKSKAKSYVMTRSLEVCCTKLTLDVAGRLDDSELLNEIMYLEKMGTVASIAASYEFCAEYGSKRYIAQWMRNIITKINSFIELPNGKLYLCPSNKYTYTLGKFLTNFGLRGNIAYIDNNPSDTNYYVKLCRDSGFAVTDVKNATPESGNIILIYHNAYSIVEDISNQLSSMSLKEGEDYISIYS